MSKWGYMSKGLAEERIDDDPEKAAETMAEMAKAVEDQEVEISAQKDKIIELESQIRPLAAGNAHLAGYIERVKELDPPKPEPERRR